MEENPAEQASRNNPVVRINPGLNIWEELEHQRSALAYKEECVLYSKGWHHTSNNPIFTWMWEKTWNGTRYMVNRQTALKIQERLDVGP